MIGFACQIQLMSDKITSQCFETILTKCFHLIDIRMEGLTNYNSYFKIVCDPPYKAINSQITYDYTIVMRNLSDCVHADCLYANHFD